MTEQKKLTRAEQIKAKYNSRIAELYKEKQKALETEKTEQARKNADRKNKDAAQKDLAYLSLLIGKFYVRSMLDGKTNAGRLLTVIKESLKEGCRDRIFIDRQIACFANRPKRRTTRTGGGAAK
jgi:lysozyme family protein